MRAGIEGRGVGFIKDNKENYSIFTTNERATIRIGAYRLDPNFRKHEELSAETLEPEIRDGSR